MTATSPHRLPETAPGHQPQAPFSPGLVAAGLFRHRQGYASRLIAEGKLTRAEAEDKLRPWLAIAAAAGADLPELVEHGFAVWPGQGQPATHRILAAEICLPHEWREALAAARDAALGALKQHSDSANESPNISQARDLIRLANSLNVRTWKP